MKIKEIVEERDGKCKNGCYRNCKFSMSGSVIITETTMYLCPCDCHKMIYEKKS